MVGASIAPSSGRVLGVSKDRVGPDGERRPGHAAGWLAEDRPYQAKDWSRARRVVLVIQEKPDEFLLHYFWLLTSWAAEEKDAETLFETYRPPRAPTRPPGRAPTLASLANL